jgi:hypothetical protein
VTTQFRRTLDAAAAGTAITTAEPERYQRVATWATQQSRRLELQALGDMAYAATERAAALAYEQVGGHLVGVHADGRIRFVAPWSKHSRQWPLSAAQRELVRALLFAAVRQHEKGGAPPPLFFFDGDRRRWVCNLGDYPSTATATTWFAWARAAWTAATIDTALQWLERRTPDGRQRGAPVGAAAGSNRALG